MNNKEKMENVKKNSSKNKKSHYQKKNNSNLDWYYQNNFKKKNNDKTNNKKKNYNNTKKKYDREINTLVKKEVIPKEEYPQKNNIEKQVVELEKIIVKKQNNKKIPKKINYRQKERSDKQQSILENTILPKKKKNSDSKLNKDKKGINTKNRYENKIEEFNGLNKILTNTIYGRRILNLYNDKESKKERKKIYLKESLLITALFSISNIVAYFLIDNIMIINITNMEFINLILTFLINFILLLPITFLIDYTITEIFVKKEKKQHKEGDSYKNRRFIKGENKKDIKNKGRK